jgi:hypothetical protein
MRALLVAAATLLCVAVAGAARDSASNLKTLAKVRN